jgi:carbon-monoxide dehydrogenase medium subunit
LQEVFLLLAENGPNVRSLAGGTDFMVRFRNRHWIPGVVVDLKDAKDLPVAIGEVDGCVRIGARAVMTEVIKHPLIRRHFPALADAANVVGSVQIRNRATLAGNVCNASPAADTVPPLLAYGAIVNIGSSLIRRRVPLSEFFVGPGRTILEEGEVVLSIDLPIPVEPTGSAFGRIARRWGVDLATVNLSCCVTGSGETRFAYGAVGPTPILAIDATGLLASPHASDRDKETILSEFISRTSPRTDVRGSREYRLAMLGVMSRRCLCTAIARRDSAA